MSVGESLRKTVSFFGGPAGGDDDEDYYDDDSDDARDDDRLSSTGQFERPSFKHFDGEHSSSTGSADYDDTYRHEAPSRPASQGCPGERPLAVVRPPRTTLCLVVPREFDDAQQIADRFRKNLPVIVNLQGCEADLARRVVDFCSGTAYALDGRLQRIADKIFLLAPQGVELSSAETTSVLSKGFFNQL
ncbi:MAG: cell division protein SepF [Thermoleophilia bacterium]